MKTRAVDDQAVRSPTDAPSYQRGRGLVRGRRMKLGGMRSQAVTCRAGFRYPEPSCSGS